MLNKTTPQTHSLTSLQGNIESVRQRIERACAKVGRDPKEVRLLPVSKTVDEVRMRLAFAAGCTEFGENKVQEAREKAEAMADLGIRWSVIGHLQSNKAKYVARFAHEFQALDRIHVAEVLERRLQIEQRSLDVFVQVNSSGETSKYGVSPENVPAFVSGLSQFTALNLKGLMTLAVFSSDADRVRSCFQLMRTLRDRLRQNAATDFCGHELSMGMSGDFEIAIETGATVVRVGQAIFGARSLPDSHYWP